MEKLQSAFKKIKELVSDFKANENYYLSSKYSEAEVREDYINKFFAALGWDVSHKIQKNPYEQEVKIEKGVKVGRAQKRADYAFHLSPNFRDSVFFVEAKKPARTLANADDYFQAIRYGWNANTPIVILTDFEEFHIIDSRFKPDIDTALNKKLQYFHYSDYAIKDKFSKLYYLFSREAVGMNSIENYAESLPTPKGKAIQRQLFPGGYKSIDESFLEDIDEMRIILARAFNSSNPELRDYELTEATQRTIDRLVFIRFLEDKLIEQEHYISEFGESNDAWDDFIGLSNRLDAKYNGVVFKKHLIDEPDFKNPKNVFHNICNDICHLNSPYDFDKIPIHILGSIYERFLGKVIQISTKGVTLEEKPAVKKAGGVYYTPQYIVRYIVENTIGKLIEGKTPLQISRMRFADIACGSGSFLITVYDLLLHYHNNWYQNNPSKSKIDGCYFQDGKWILSLQQKKNILLNNIYGVDIDSQAVEVTQLSLYLKLVEDESTATTNEMQVLFHEQILPDLTNNIICGNSLIEWDIENGILFPNENTKEVNPMSFRSSFSNIFENGGFDVIVGNPPYLSMENMNNIHRDYYYGLRLDGSKRFKTAIHKSNLYSIFYERAISLIKSNGQLGYITPYSWLSNSSFRNLREIFLLECKINILHFYPLGVFQDAGITTGTVILRKEENKGNSTIEISDFREIELLELPNIISNNSLIKNIPINIFINSKDYIFNVSWDKSESQIFNKIETVKTLLGDLVSIQRGCDTANNKKFTGIKYLKSRNPKKLLRGRNFGRYWSNWDGSYLYYEPVKMKADKLTARPGNKDRFEGLEKLIIYRFLDSNNRIIGQFDDLKYYCFGSCYVINKLDVNLDLRFILGVLNSKLIGFYNSKLFSGVKVTRNELLRIPIPVNQISLINKISILVKKLIDSKQQLFIAKIDKDINYFQRKCNNIDREIDIAVFTLYNLSEEDIVLIQQS